MVALTESLHLAGGKRDGPGAIAAHRGVIVFAVQRYRHNLSGFRVGFTGQRQRLVVLGGIDDIVLRERIDRERWRSGIHANRLASAHGIPRRVFAADVDRPGAIAQRLRVCRWHFYAPRAVSPYFRRVGFTVQRHGNVGSLRQMLAAAGQRKTGRLLAGVYHVVTRRCRQRNGGLGRGDGYRDAACRGGFAAVDLHDRPRMLSVRLGREFHRPGAVFTHHRAGNGASAAVFDLNGRARLAATAKGRGVIVRDRVRAQHTLLVTHLVRQQKGRRGTFHFFGIINDFRFRFAVTTVGQQRPDGATA
ncbi:Uncharacterised protein [Enterobacter kobei]|nr:Uncharacterised protein [Enterobacter kobei]